MVQVRVGIRLLWPALGPDLSALYFIRLGKSSAMTGKLCTRRACVFSGGASHMSVLRQHYPLMDSKEGKLTDKTDRSESPGSCKKTVQLTEREKHQDKNQPTNKQINTISAHMFTHLWKTNNQNNQKPMCILQIHSKGPESMGRRKALRIIHFSNQMPKPWAIFQQLQAYFI